MLGGTIGIPLAQETAQIQFRPSISGMLALLAGFLILIYPRFLNYYVAVYLIFVGLVALFNLNI